MSKREAAEISKKAVIKYVAALVVIVLFFILLSYFMQERSDHQIEALYAENTTAQQKIERLQTENVDLRAQAAELEMTLAARDTRIAELGAELDELKKNWAADTKAIEDQYKADYNELLQKYNVLLEQSGEI
jgi:uncharacterized protein involved in exopolysaccharide biosynthesis